MNALDEPKDIVALCIIDLIDMGLKLRVVLKVMPKPYSLLFTEIGYVVLAFS